MSTSPNLDASARMKEPVCAPVHSPKLYFSIGPSSHAPVPSSLSKTVFNRVCPRCKRYPQAENV